ncbi:hypothetical protein FKM82_016801 [Ascaphus truei]
MSTETLTYTRLSPLRTPTRISPGRQPLLHTYLACISAWCLLCFLSSLCVTLDGAETEAPSITFSRFANLHPLAKVQS